MLDLEGKKSWLPEVSMAEMKRMEAEVEGEFGLPRVLSHGDLHVNNIIFNKDATRLRALVDWQLVHPSTMLKDLGRVMLMAEAGMRRKEEARMLKRFHARFTAQVPPEKGFRFLLLHQKLKGADGSAT